MTRPKTQRGQLAFPLRLCTCACALSNFLSHVFPVEQRDTRGMVRWRRTEADVRYPAPSALNHSSSWLSAHRTGDCASGTPTAKLCNRNTCLPRTWAQPVPVLHGTVPSCSGSAQCSGAVGDAACVTQCIIVGASGRFDSVFILNVIIKLNTDCLGISISGALELRSWSALRTCCLWHMFRHRPRDPQIQQEIHH